MPLVVILTQAERDAVVGPSAVDLRQILDPIALSDGTYYVGVEALSGVIFAAAKYTTIRQKPQVDISTLAAVLVKPFTGSRPFP